MIGRQNSKTLNKYLRNLIDGILKSRGFGELKNGVKGERKHSCEAIPAQFFFPFHWIQKYAHKCVCLHDSGVTGNRVQTQDECFHESDTQCKKVRLSVSRLAGVSARPQSRNLLLHRIPDADIPQPGQVVKISLFTQRSSL